MAFTLRMKDDETYTECYARTLGPVDRYAKMSEKQLIKRLSLVNSSLGATLLMLRREAHSLTANELLPLFESHREAVLKEIHAIT